MAYDYNQYKGDTAVPEVYGLSGQSFKDQVDQQLIAASKEVERLTELKALLANNPETQRILELMRGRL